eukprot:gene4243-6022_t
MKLPPFSCKTIASTILIAVTLLFFYIFGTQQVVKTKFLHPNKRFVKHDIVMGDAIRYFVDGKSQAKCLDGTLPSFYLRKSPHFNTSNVQSKKWFVFFEGGGWCYNLRQCYLRSKTILGSSRAYPFTLNNSSFNYYLSNNDEYNPLMFDWNIVLVRYCDGTSYAGDATVMYKNKPLYFRGKYNRDETIKSLLSLGMLNASEVVIGGCSAGGLGIYLGLDNMQSIMNKANDKIIIRGFSDSGYFMQYSSSKSCITTYQSFGKDEACVNNRIDYPSAVKSLFYFANISSGVNANCLQFMRSNKKEDSNCFFADNAALFIKTPLFAVQPQYDQWQILHVIGGDNNQLLVNEFGHNLTSSLQKSLLVNSDHGAFIDSCSHHCTSCSVSNENSWHGSNIRSSVGNKSEATAFSTWYLNSLMHRFRATIVVHVEFFIKALSKIRKQISDLLAMDNVLFICRIILINVKQNQHNPKLKADHSLIFRAIKHYRIKTWSWRHVGIKPILLPTVSSNWVVSVLQSDVKEKIRSGTCLCPPLICGGGFGWW